MAINETGAISVGGLQSPSKWIHSFLIEVYSDSGLTTLVARKQPLFKWNQPTLTNLQQEIATIAGLTWGDTYYVRVGSVTPVTGTVNWSNTIEVQAGDTIIGGPTITAPFSQTAPAGEFFDSYDSDTGLFGSSAPSSPVALTVVFPNTATGRSVTAFVGSSDFTLTIPSGLSSWRAKIGTNPGATATYSFKKAVYSGGSWGAPTEFGTLQVSTGGALTWTSASGATIGDNEALIFDEPTDSTLANVSITAHGTR